MTALLGNGQLNPTVKRLLILCVLHQHARWVGPRPPLEETLQNVLDSVPLRLSATHRRAIIDAIKDNGGWR